MSIIITGELGFFLKIIFPFFRQGVWLNAFFFVSLPAVHFLFGLGEAFVPWWRNQLNCLLVLVSIFSFLIQTTKVQVLYLLLFIFSSVHQTTISSQSQYSIVNVCLVLILPFGTRFEHHHISPFILEHCVITKCSWVCESNLINAETIAGIELIILGQGMSTKWGRTWSFWQIRQRFV